MRSWKCWKSWSNASVCQNSEPLSLSSMILILTLPLDLVCKIPCCLLDTRLSYVTRHARTTTSVPNRPTSNANLPHSNAKYHSQSTSNHNSPWIDLSTSDMHVTANANSFATSSCVTWTDCMEGCLTTSSDKHSSNASWLSNTN